MPIARRLASTRLDDLAQQLTPFTTSQSLESLLSAVEQPLIRVSDLSADEARLLDRPAPGTLIRFTADRSEALVSGTAQAIAALAEQVQREAPALAAWLRRCLTTSTSHVLRCGSRTVMTGGKTYVMGIINMTVDSFSGDGLADNIEAAVAQGKRFVAEGAAILDIGGESARADVPVETEAEEIRRVVPVISRLRRECDAIISIDTYKPAVAAAAVAAGAEIINDIGGFKLDTGTARVAAETGAALVLNYTYERPKVRPTSPPRYSDLIATTIRFLAERIEIAVQAGVAQEQLIIDPGVAFGKSHDEDLEVLRRLPELAVLDRPILVAASRKHFIGAVLDLPPEERLEGTAAITALSIAGGADILRVHDVKEMSRVARMSDALVRQRLGAFAASDESWPWPAARRR